ncbi:MAG: cytochrome d ubiquinol oxidase subunit II [Actinomycetota bacterium]
MNDRLAILTGIWVGLTLYALLGGADFGGGVWTLLASGRSKARQREVIADTIAPVWEANHVWLIFVITDLFAGFPRAFEVLSVALYVPFSIALAGIVFRGAAFAFRAHGGAASRWSRMWTDVFGIASLVTPFVLGASAGAIAAGGIRVGSTFIQADAVRVWLRPLPVVTGLLGLATCASLAASYLTVEARAHHDRELEDAFRMRAIVASLGAGGLAVAGVLVVRADAPLLWHGMLHRGLGFLFVSAGGGVASLTGLVWRRYRLARAGAIVAVAAVIGGWGASQWPLMIVPDLTVARAAAPASVLRALAIGMAAGGALLVPSLVVLFRVFKSSKAMEHG